MRLRTGAPWHYLRMDSLQWAVTQLKKELRYHGYELKTTNFQEEDESALIQDSSGELYVVVDLDAGGSSVNVSGWPAGVVAPLMGLPPDPRREWDWSQEGKYDEDFGLESAPD